jgi:elongation factor Ts
MSPKYVSKEEVPADVVAKEKEVLMEEIKSSGKPAEIAEKIVEGRLGKFYEEICLLEQPFVKDQTKKISDLLNEKIAKIGEKLEIKRFCRFEIGA